MSEVLVVNWWLILSTLWFVAGAAMILSYLSFSETIKLVSINIGKYILWSGSIVLLTGLSTGVLLVDNINLINTRIKGDLPEAVQLDKGSYYPDLKKLNCDGVKKDNGVEMVVNGKLETPLYCFNGKSVTLSFYARGSVCKGEYTILKIVYEELSRNELIAVRLKEYVELTEEMKRYDFNINSRPGKCGRIIISFVNDDFDYKNKPYTDRNLWFSKLELTVK